MNTKPEIFKYEYRREQGDNPQNFLISFNCTPKNVDRLIATLLIILEEMGFDGHGGTELWMNDEILLHFSSPNGRITLSKDVWSLVFIMGSKNQTDIKRIEEALQKHENFQRVDSVES